MLLQVQRILNLKQAPQEKMEGSKTPEENWSKEGSLIFKDDF